MWSGGKRLWQRAAGQAQGEQSFSSQAAVPVSLPTQTGAAMDTALSWALHSPALLPSPAPAKQISDSFSRTSAAAASESLQSPGVCVFLDLAVIAIKTELKRFGVVGFYPLKVFLSLQGKTLFCHEIFSCRVLST